MVNYVADLYAAAEVSEYEDARELDTGDLSALQVRGHEIGQPIPVYAVRQHRFKELASRTKEELRERVRENVSTGDLGELQVREVQRSDE